MFSHATYMWGGSIKIGARPFWGRSVFVLVISNISIGFKKSLTLPLNISHDKKCFLSVNVN